MDMRGKGVILRVKFAKDLNTKRLTVKEGDGICLEAFKKGLIAIIKLMLGPLFSSICRRVSSLWVSRLSPHLSCPQQSRGVR